MFLLVLGLNTELHRKCNSFFFIKQFPEVTTWDNKCAETYIVSDITLLQTSQSIPI